MNTTETTPPIRRAYEWVATIGACLLFGPFVLPFVVDIAAHEGGWRPWAFVAVPMVGLIVLRGSRFQPQ